MADAPTQAAQGEDFPKRCFAYTPSDNSSTWKLRGFKHPTDTEPDAGCVGGCLAALGPAGFRGQHVQIPAADLPAVKAQVRAWWVRLNGNKPVPSIVANGNDMAKRNVAP